MTMFHRVDGGSGSFPDDSKASDFDAIFDDSVLKDSPEIKSPSKRKSLKPKTLLNKLDIKSFDAPRKQRKFRKKHYYKELEFDSSLDQSKEKDGLDRTKTLNYHDPDLELPVLWNLISDKFADDEQKQEDLTSTTQKSECDQDNDIESLIFSDLSNYALPAVSEIVEEDEGQSGTDSVADAEQSMSSQKSATYIDKDDKERALLAMRDLVLRQQSTLLKMDVKNKEYKKKLASCQDRVLKLKMQQLDREDHVMNLELENESLEAENLWLREELVTIRDELETHKSRQEQSVVTISELRNEQAKVREESKATAKEIHMARRELYTMMNQDDDSDGSNSDMVSSSNQSSFDLHHGVGDLRRMISRLKATESSCKLSVKKSNNAVEWLDISEIRDDPSAQDADWAQQRLADDTKDEKQIPEYLACNSSGEPSLLTSYTSSETPSDIDVCADFHNSRAKPHSGTATNLEARDETRSEAMSTESYSEKRSDVSLIKPKTEQEANGTQAHQTLYMSTSHEKPESIDSYSEVASV